MTSEFLTVRGYAQVACQNCTQVYVRKHYQRYNLACAHDNMKCSSRHQFMQCHVYGGVPSAAVALTHCA